MLLPLKLAFAGLGSLFLHWGIGVAIMAACCVIEFAGAWLVSVLPILKSPIEFAQKYVLYVLVVTAALLVGQYIGARDIAKRCEAQAAIVSTTVNKATTDAIDADVAKDKWTTDK